MVEHLNFSFPNIPDAFDGMTLAVISDLHAGAMRRADGRIRAIVQQVNALQPDAILLLGDIVHSRRRADRYIPLLSDLQAHQGVWACLGNHEHGFVWYSRYIGPTPGPSPDHWRETYAGAGIDLLVNEARPLQKDGERIWIAGVDDAYSGNHDLPAALSHVPDGEFCLTITHHPDLIDEPRIGEVDLLLAGHTHGGQIRIPGLSAIYGSCRNPRRRAAGFVRDNGTIMYVTRGVGEGIPIRIACPRQLPLIALHLGEPAAWTTETYPQPPPGGTSR